MKLIGFTDQFVHLLGTGLVAMGIMDFMEEDEGENADVEGGGVGNDDPFGDGLDDGGADDAFADMGDGMGMDGGMDDWADGGGGDEFAMGGGTDATQELENRIDELENEVADISSTVGTVRSENEEISATVDETEENVRKLLEIYEMVTRGVNPFVDDVQEGGMGAFGDDGGFGLFDGEEEEEEADGLDDDLANAEAESFFDDDFDDEGDEDPVGEDAGDDLGFEPPDDEPDAEETATADGEADGGEQAGGSTFAELKEEYESGDADWADGDEDLDADGDGKIDGDAAEETASGADPSAEVDSTPTDESTAEEFEFDQPAESTGSAATPASNADPRGKPYLAELPNGYVSDLVVMEWLEFLVTEFGPADAVRTIEYYGDIGWVSEPVEKELLTFLSGFTDVESVDVEETGPATLEIDDHIQSLTFLSQLTGATVERRIVEHCARVRGGQDGIQR